MTQSLNRAKGLADGFTPGQRGIVIVAVIALLMGAFALSRWVSQPSWAPLFGNLSGSDASAVVDELNADGIKYKLADGGQTILIPQDQVYDERIALLGKGVPTGDGEDGWSLLDKQGITATDFQQNIAYQRAIQGELAKTLEAMDGVNTAVVNLAVPKKDVFSSETDKTTSSVLLALKPGTDLSNEQITSITNLVAGSVAGLDPDDVTVTDQTGAMLAGGGTRGGGGSGSASATDEQTAAFEDRQAKAAQEVLDKLVGPGHSVVRVNAQLNFDDTDATSKTFAAPSPTVQPISEANVNESYGGNNAAAGGSLGVILPTAVSTSGATGNYSRQQNTRNNAVDETVTKTKTAPGGVKRMTVAVVLDAKTAGPLNTNTVQQLVANAVGLDAARGDVVQVSALPFDTTAAAAATKALADAASAAQTAQYVEIGKKAAIALLIVIILFLVMRRRKKDAESMIDATASDLPGSGLVLAANQPAAISASEQLAITAQADLSRDKMRDDVAALVDNQPDDVAQMLQGWLLERKS
ncbi:MAG TPA: flagellar basal-body MS-ring/collar protein FliF [Kineosporiaceae bacterium]|nr:flagellar basal-body MS-ring/collar protein FliF [Kineosporiaceae bacterium]